MPKLLVAGMGLGETFKYNTADIRYTTSITDTLTAATAYFPSTTGWDMEQSRIDYFNLEAYVKFDSIATADTTTYAVLQYNLGTTAIPQWVTDTSTAINIRTESTDYKLSKADISYDSFRIYIYGSTSGNYGTVRLILYNKRQ